MTNRHLPAIARFALIASFGILALAGARAEDGFRESVQDLAAQLAAGRSAPWKIDIPGDAERVIDLDPPLFRAAAVRFKIRLDARGRNRRPPRPVRCLIVLRNRQGWSYQSRVTPALPVKGSLDFRIDLSGGSADWDPVDHFRPWDAAAGRAIKQIRLRLFSDRPYRGSVLIEAVRADPLAEPAARPLRIVDLRTPRGARVGDRVELAFRLDVEIPDPFDPDACDIRAYFNTPTGGRIMRPAFYFQDFVERSEGTRRRLAPKGLGEWRVRFTPREKGQYKYQIKTGGDRLLVERWLRVGPAEGSGAVSSGYAGPRSEPGRSFAKRLGESYIVRLGREAALVDPIRRADSGPRRKDFVPLPPLADRPAVLRSGRWQFEPDPVPNAAWTVRTEWHPAWGRWQGLGQYNLEVAWQFDRVLEAAEKAGVALPLALLDDRAFFDRGKYRWAMNPLNAAVGGPLSGPSQFFLSAAEYDAWSKLDRKQGKPMPERAQAYWYFIKRSRYIMARYGHSPAISSWVLGSAMPANGVPAWHGRVARDLGPLETAGRDLFSLHPLATGFARRARLGAFEQPSHRLPRGVHAWKVDSRITPHARQERDRSVASEGNYSLRITGKFPGEACIHKIMDGNLADFEKLMFDVFVPARERGGKPSPHDMRVLIYIRDGEELWYEQLLEPLLRPGDWTKLVVDLTGASAERWENLDHGRPFDGYTRQRIREVGLRFFCGRAYQGPIYVDNIRAAGRQAGRKPNAAPPKFRIIESTGEKCPRFSRYEVTFGVDRVFKNPFDPAQADIVITVVSQRSGRTREIPCFFYQGYTRKLFRRRESLTPEGASVWKARFCPEQTGPHRWKIELRDPGGGKPLASTGWHAFTATPSKTRGYIRVAKDRRHFEHVTGEFYYPIGMNLRSPSDDRGLGKTPKIRSAALAAATRGTYQYDDYFKSMEKAGMNWGRVWMCSWWLSLEWYRKWPGYHGLGRYNMQNAWRLDHLVEDAETKGIYLQIDTANHGQFSTKVDHEWEYNPLNRFERHATILNTQPGQIRRKPRARGSRRPGGILDEARDMFDVKRFPAAARSHQNKLRYVAARWGYSPNIMAWVLCSEVEFTEEYWLTAYGRGDRSPKTSHWHGVMARFLKKIDQGRHVISTHFAMPNRGHLTWQQNPELEFAFSNAYSSYPLPAFKADGKQGSGLGAPFAMRVFYNQFMLPFNRPVLVGEWGGHWMGNTPEVLDAELRTGSWAMVMLPMAGNTGYWWWPYVHFADRYGDYAAVRRFMKDEDRRGVRWRQVVIPTVAGSRGQLSAMGLAGRDRADLYVYHKQAVRKLTNLPKIKGARLKVPGMRGGRYRVEFWDCGSGRVRKTARVTAAGGKLVVPLPDVSIDVALKVRAERRRGRR